MAKRVFSWEGYRSMNVSLGKLYKLGLANRGSGWVKYVKLWYKEGDIRIHYLPRFWVKVIAVLIYPILVLLWGVVNYREVNEDTLRILFPYKYGSYSSDTSWEGGRLHQPLKDLINRKGVK